jgi:hypothetical protein
MKALLNEANSDKSLSARGRMDFNDLEDMSNQAGNIANGRDALNRGEVVKQWSDQGDRDRKGMLSTGVAREESIYSEDGKSSRKLLVAGEGADKLSASGKQAANLALALTEKKIGLAGLSDDQRKDGLLEVANMSKEEHEKIQNMTLEEKRAYAKYAQGSESGDIAMDSIGQQQKLTGISKATKGNLGATGARFLGLNLGKDTEQLLAGKSPEQVAAILSKTLGAEGESGKAFQGDLQEALEHVKAGKADAGDLLARAKSGASADVQEKIKRAGQSDEQNTQEDMLKELKEATKYLKDLSDTQAKDSGFLSTIAGNTSKPPDPTEKKT